MTASTPEGADTIAADWTLIYEPDGRPSPFFAKTEPGRKLPCTRDGCGRTATYYSAVRRNGPTLQVCGPHMGGCKRTWKSSGETWTVLSPGAPELAAFDKANAEYAREQHAEIGRYFGLP